MRKILLAITMLFFGTFISCNKEEPDNNISNCIEINGKLKIVERNGDGSKYILKGDVTNEVDSIFIYSDTERIFFKEVVSSNGEFLFNFPIPSSDDLWSISDEFADFSVSDRTVNILVVWILGFKNGKRIGTIKKISDDFVGNMFVEFVYVDKNVQLTGSFNYEETSFVKTIEYNANLKKGWNTIFLKVSENENGETWKYTANNEPSNMIWTLEFYKSLKSDYHSENDPSI